MSITEILKEVGDEYERVVNRHEKINSFHEGYAVILEELDELWTEIKKRPSQRSSIDMKDEAVQVATMVVRFIHDLL